MASIARRDWDSEQTKVRARLIAARVVLNPTTPDAMPMFSLAYADHVTKQ